MCGRFTQYNSISTLKEAFGIKTITCEAKPSYNIAPAQDILTIIIHEEKRLGKLKIHIRVVDNSGKVYFDQRKTIVAGKKSFKITLNLKDLVTGEYSIVVDALDLLTGKSDMKYVQAKYKE